MRIILIAFCLIFSVKTFAQHRITGSLVTETGQPVSNAMVTLKNKENILVHYNQSNHDGAFALSYPDSLHQKGLYIEIAYLGFKKSTTYLLEGKTTYKITLEQSSFDLEAVEIKSRPLIRKIGDTTSYNVASFAQKEDRTINDVIKRMPGMEVEENGKIKFNGKNISNLTIDGDDLLDDKYAIGTKTIPFEMVQDLQVLENHQSKKVLKGKAFSDDVSINLKIKEDAKLKLTGQAKAGAGLPGQYEGELNSILFNKTFKMLNSAKGNNTGYDLQADLTGFNENTRLTTAGNSRPSNLLSLGTVGNPSLPTNRYYLNNSVAVSANNLFKFGVNDWQLKTNLSMFADKNEMAYNSLNQLTLGNETFNFTEEQYIDKNPFLTDLSLKLEANKDQYFFNNTLKLNYSKQRENAHLINNNVGMTQSLHNSIRDFSNHLQYMPAINKKNVISIDWYLNHYNKPQDLRINSGLHASTLNNGNPFESINQIAETPTWFSNATVGYRFAKGLIKQNYQFGVLNEWQELNSEIQLTQLSGQINVADQSANQLNWNRMRTYLNAGYELNYNKWEMRLSLPIALQNIHYRDHTFSLNEKQKNWLITPYVNIKYHINTEDNVAINYAYSNNLGNINGVFRGTILTNYRSLQANAAELQARYAHSTGLNYQFKRTLEMLYLNMGINYSSATANSIASRVINNNISQTILLPYENNVSTLSGNFGFSKYVYALGATGSLKSNLNTSRFNQFINGNLLPFNSISYSIIPTIETRLFNQRINAKYEAVANWTESKPLENSSNVPLTAQKIHNLDQSLSMSYSPLTNVFVRVSGRHQLIKQPSTQNINYLFTDANIRYKAKKLKADFELDLTNLGNIKNYEAFIVSANQFISNQYNLRGRMAVLKAAFNI